jgi:hypothetical protein
VAVIEYQFPSPPSIPRTAAEISWATRAAARRNQRAADKYPLLAFAGQLPGVTPNALLTAEDERRRRLIAGAARMARAAAHYRAAVARRVSAEDLRELDRRRLLSPPTPEYSADFWWQEVKRLRQLRARGGVRHG